MYIAYVYSILRNPLNTPFWNILHHLNYQELVTQDTSLTCFSISLNTRTTSLSHFLFSLFASLFFSLAIYSFPLCFYISFLVSLLLFSLLYFIHTKSSAMTLLPTSFAMTSLNPPRSIFFLTRLVLIRYRLHVKTIFLYVPKCKNYVKSLMRLYTFISCSR